MGATTTDLTATAAEEHIGLMVYNVKEDLCAAVSMEKGMHVWDGTTWQSFTNKISYYEDSRDQLLGT